MPPIDAKSRDEDFAAQITHLRYYLRHEGHSNSVIIPYAGYPLDLQTAVSLILVWKPNGSIFPYYLYFH